MRQIIGRVCMVLGALLILAAAALLAYNKWDADRADKASLSDRIARRVRGQ